MTLVLAGCPAPALPPPAAPSQDGGWRTLRAEQQLELTVDAPDGRQQRRMRAAIAIERPSRFRLRALGPGGITLMDIVSVDGKTEVLQALRDAKEGSRTASLVAAMAGDLAAAYDLAPRPADRVATVGKDAIVVREGGRTVTLRDFRGTGGKSYPAAIDVDNAAEKYHVHIVTRDAVLDEALDPALFPTH